MPAFVYFTARAAVTAISCKRSRTAGASAARGRFFDQFLMRGLLHRAVALAQMHDVAVFVAEHLHLDVPRRTDQLLDVHAPVFERRFGFGERGRERGRQIGRRLDRAHAFPAAAGRRFEQDRIADLSAAAAASSADATMSLPGVVGTPDSRMMRLAVALSPIAAITAGVGPMNVRP